MSNDTEPNEFPSYHDVHVTTAKMKRTSIFDLPYGYELTCNRVGGWTLWGPASESAWTGRVSDGGLPVMAATSGPAKVAGEYDEGLRIDVAGHVICDSLTKAQAPA